MSSRRERHKPQNTINRQLEHRAADGGKNDNLIELGKFFYTLAGMTYAGVILTVLMNFDDGRIDILMWGSFALVLLTILAWETGKTWKQIKHNSIMELVYFFMAVSAVAVVGIVCTNIASRHRMSEK